MTPDQRKATRRIWLVISIGCIVAGFLRAITSVIEGNRAAVLVGGALMAAGVFSIWFSRRRFQ